MAKYNITKLDVIEIIKNLVIAYPYSECNQINTFALVDSADDFELDSLGKTYQDYLNGTFWSRKWVLGGRDPNKLSKQYPILAIEQKQYTKKGLDSKQSCFEFGVTLLDVPDCPTCQDKCKRTPDQVDCDIQDAMMIFQAELCTVGLYKVKPIDGEEKLVWVTSGQIAQWMNPDNPLIEYYYHQMDLLDFLEDGQASVFSTNVGLRDNARGVSFFFKVCGCPALKKQFNYLTNNNPKEIATARCESC